MQPLPVAQAQALVSLLHQLVQQQQWDVRHGGLLGLKYLLAARPDAAQHLLVQAVPAAILGLQVMPLLSGLLVCVSYPCQLLSSVQAFATSLHQHSGQLPYPNQEVLLKKVKLPYSTDTSSTVPMLAHSACSCSMFTVATCDITDVNVCVQPQSQPSMPILVSPK